MKHALYIIAKTLGVLAGLVFFCPARVINHDFATGFLIQIAIAGPLALIALVCWHFSDTNQPSLSTKK
jgi:hypothetical protein